MDKPSPDAVVVMQWYDDLPLVERRFIGAYGVRAWNAWIRTNPKVTLGEFEVEWRLLHNYPQNEGMITDG